MGRRGTLVKDHLKGSRARSTRAKQAGMLKYPNYVLCSEVYRKQTFDLDPEHLQWKQAVQRGMPDGFLFEFTCPVCSCTANLVSEMAASQTHIKTWVFVKGSTGIGTNVCSMACGVTFTKSVK